MTTLSVLGLNTLNGASEELDTILSLQDRQVLEVIDAAVVIQEGVRKKPENQTTDQHGGCESHATSLLGARKGSKI